MAYVIGGLGAGLFAWLLLDDSWGKRYREEVLGAAPASQRLKVFLARVWELFAGVLARERTRVRLTAAGMPPSAIIPAMAITMGIVALMLWGAVLALWWAAAGGVTVLLAVELMWLVIPGAFIGWVVSQHMAFSVYRNWRRKLKSGIPNLIQFLKVRLQAGDNPPTAVINVLPFVPGVLKSHWRTLVDQLRSGIAFGDALRELSERLHDNDLTAVLDRLVYYNQSGVPDDPFGDLGEHMARLQSIQATYRVKRMEGPVHLYVLGAFLGVLMVTLVPYFAQVGKSLFGF